MRAFTVLLLTLLLCQLVRAQGIISPGAVWPDGDGHHIQAHGGGIIRVGDYYYWYGEERRQGLDTNYRYVSCYRSKDLANWKFMGDALRLSDPEQLGSHWVLERPKVYFNRKGQTYVMYFHLDDARYKFARVGVAVSRRPEGPFTYRESFRPLDRESRDIGQFIDDDGTAYLIFESRPTKGFFIARLSSDYLKVEKAVCLVDAPLEGGAVVHYKGLYYVIGSALTGWRPNPNKYAVSTSLAGPWSEFRDIAPPGTNTYGSQSTMLLKVAGIKDTAIIFMADQWRPGTQWDSRYLWMPVKIGDGKLWVPKPVDWSIGIHTGEVSTLQAFQHPGVLHSMRDLGRMREDVAVCTGAVKQDATAMAGRVYDGYKLFAADPASQADYKMQGPMEMVGRNPTVGATAYDNDANAAYQNAVMWAITGDSSHAQKAIGIINAWSSTLKEVTGRDAALMAGLGPFKMVNAAEIIRYTHAGWKEEDITRTENHFKDIIYPVIKDFAPFANGNWDAAAIKTAMAIGVFCDDRAVFERALRYYTDGWGNGAIRHYVVNEEGQLQESGRDQPHSQLGIGMLAEACAIAWNQGLDLYGYDDNRLLKGFEYTAKFNLGNDDVPFVKWLDRTGKYYHERISQQGRGQLRAVYEQVYNHYVVVRGLKAPFVQQAAEKLRPEGPGRPGADHPGYGTLFFSHPDSLGMGVPMAPAGLIATGREGAVELSWIKAIHAKYYIVRRAERQRGPYTIVATGVRGGRWTDRLVLPRRMYYYTVTAANELGASGFALPQAAFTGLPAGWHAVTIGDVHTGSAVWDGAGLTVDADGMGADSGFHFTYLPLKGDGMLTVRMAPQPSSQFSTMGLMLRRSVDAGSPFVALMIRPGKSGSVEAPDWHTELLGHSAPRALAGGVLPGGRPGHLTGDAIEPPAVTNGRITGYYWLRLVRKGKKCRGFVSYDGTGWRGAGSIGVDFSGNCLLGIAVGSGMANTTVIHFDHVEAADSVPGPAAAVGTAGGDAANVRSDPRPNVRPDVWQWSVPVRGARKEGSTAYLWVPETCRRLRGVVLAQHNMEEISILENAYFRSEMGKLGFGIVWVSPFFDRLFRFNEGAGAMLDSFMTALADSSGYTELKYVPIVTMGHSAAASWPYYFSVWNADRALCAISVSGQWPWFRDPQFAPDIWDDRKLDHIPCLETMGEYEAAGTWSIEGLKERMEHPLVPLSMLACPAEGHFAASEKKIHYLSLYIKKAVEYRLPENYTGDGSAKLRPIDPTRTGWLMEKWRPGEEPRTQPAPVGGYTGDTTQAFWFFDKEMAMATVDYERWAGKKMPQLLGYIEDGSAIRQRNTHLQVDIPFRPLEDGISFVLKGGFLDAVPGESERPANWTGLPAGASIGHALGGAIKIDPVCGPVEKVNDSVFRLDLRRGENLALRRGDTGDLRLEPDAYKLYFVATHPGDPSYAPAVQQAEMSVPGRNAKGEPQHIVFPVIGDQEVSVGKVRLRAVSDKGLPVHYYVRSGPAYVDGEYIVFTCIPPRARLPMKVTVVAWQYGRAGAAPIQSAEPVVQSFYLNGHASAGQVTQACRISSPDGSTVFETGTDSQHHLLYRVSSHGREVIGWSAMGLANGKEQTVSVQQLSQSAHRETFAWPFGERDSVENNYNDATLRCSGAGLCYQIETRVYNGTAAFRYRSVDSASPCQFTRELTSFGLNGSYTLYQYNQESVFTPMAVDTFARTCDLPATLTDGRLFLSIGEAANDNFTKAELARGKAPHELTIVYMRDSLLTGVYTTPWRSISIARSAVGLHAFSDLGLRLSSAPEKGAPRLGLEPGKLIRAQLTTQAGLECIDFAVRHHFQYILYDAGWYGAEFRTTSDPLTPIPAIDLLRVIAYGREKGIGVILYVNYVGLRAKLDKILPLYKQWGVAGLKFGFVDGLTRHGISWLADAIRKVNDYGFILDIHDNYKPTGLSRTYPALLTQEGVRGDENGPDAWHTTVLPYTRFLAGAADFTFCFPNATHSFNKNLKVSKAQQLALTVIYYSPLQSMFWYGLPADYTNEEEIEFFNYVPTVWDETRYLAGDIGKNIAVARRRRNVWYVGCAAGMEDWDTTLRMDFLQAGKSYRVTAYEDDGKGGIRKRVMNVNKRDLLPVKIRRKGGMAMMMSVE